MQISLLELKERCNRLSGLSIQEVAATLKTPVPEFSNKTKGWVGQTIELYLGATAANKPLPDFPHLGIELKTIPINNNFQACETTYVCTAPIPPEELEWEKTRVKKKLTHVLWVPIQSNSTIPLKNRLIGTPFFWKPTANQECILKQDWQEITEMLYSGQVASLSAKFGTYLHIRPKAANSRVLVDALDENGQQIKIVPKGFYLRSSFTNQILRQKFTLD